MNSKNLKGQLVALSARWKTQAGLTAFKSIDNTLKRSEHLASNLPYGFVNGKADLRGIDFCHSKMVGVEISDADLSGADFRRVWIEKSTFTDVLCEGVDFSDMSDHENSFSMSRFIRSDFRKAAIGYKGSKFRNCLFSKCDFKKSVFIRAQFENCVFDRCKLEGVDFNVSSFVRCKFIGHLEDVWFRADYAFDGDRKKFGDFTRNRMEKVDFSEAQLAWLAFTGGVPLADVTLPIHPYVFYMDRVDKVLPLAKHAAEQMFVGKDLEASNLFFHVQLHYVKDQTEQIFTLGDYAEEGTSPDFPDRFKGLLLQTRHSLPMADDGARKEN